MTSRANKRKHAVAVRQEAARRPEDERLKELGRTLMTSAELDDVLEADEAMRDNPALRAAVRKHVQLLNPHLRDL